MPRPIDRKKLLEEFRGEQANHQAHYDELTTNDTEPERAEYNEHMVQVLEYICDLIEADIADDEQIAEEGVTTNGSME